MPISLPCSGISSESSLPSLFLLPWIWTCDDLLFEPSQVGDLEELCVRVLAERGLEEFPLFLLLLDFGTECIAYESEAPPVPFWWWLGWVFADVERALEAMVSRPRLKKSQYVRERARFYC